MMYDNIMYFSFKVSLGTFLFSWSICIYYKTNLQNNGNNIFIHY